MVIVDDNSPQDPLEHLKLTLKNMKPYFSVRVFQTHDTDCWNNPGITLNIGVKQSKGEIIILNLSDVIPLNPYTLEIISKYHKENDMTHLSATQIEADYRRMYDGKIPVFGGDHGDLSVAGCSMPRALYDKIGGFDERFRVYGHEDADFLWRIRYGAEDLGIQCRHHKDLFTLHISPAHQLEEAPCPKENEKYVNENVLGHNWIVNSAGWGEWGHLTEILTYKDGAIVNG
jgi:hypothetical protein